MCLFVEKDTKSKKFLELFYKEKIGIHTNLPEFSKGILGYSSVHIANVSKVSNNNQQPLYIVPALRYLRSRTKVKIVLKLALLKMAIKCQYICFRPQE